MRRHLPGFPIIKVAGPREVGLNVLNNPSTALGLMVQFPLNQPWTGLRIADQCSMLQLQWASLGPLSWGFRNDRMVALHMIDAANVVWPQKRNFPAFWRLWKVMGRFGTFQPGLDERARDNGMVALQVFAAPNVVRPWEGAVRMVRQQRGGMCELAAAAILLRGYWHSIFQPAAG